MINYFKENEVNAQKLLATDTKISGQSAEKVISLLEKLVSESNSAEELVAKIEGATKVTKSQYIALHGLVNMTEEKGKARSGNADLGDQILDQQNTKIKRYGQNAYRLSEKQVAVIVKNAWAWLRP